MKAHKNSTKDPFREKKGNNGKNRHEKNWRLLYQITNASKIGFRREKLNTWYNDPLFSNFISIDHAISQLNKNMRSYPFLLRRLEFKMLKLENKKTNENVAIEIRANEIVVK